MEIALTPGTLTSLPGRYAKALFDLAEEKEEVEKVGTALQSLEKVLQASVPLRHVLTNPTLSQKEQTAVLKEICVRMGAPDILQSFMAQLLKGHRILYLSKIEKLYRSLIARKKNEQIIEVVSAYPLTASQTHLLKDKLKKTIPGTLHLTFVRDPRVLGGIMIRVGSWVVDATVVTRLNQLATVMKGSV